jgi:predicted acylesterase/phospholipase RssA
MGVTFVHKSDLSKPCANPKVALVLAGGAVSGGAFKLGGLVALNSYLKNTKVTNFQIYTGVSAGSMIAAPIAAGIQPGEILKGLFGLSEVLTPLTELDFYYPNVREVLSQGFRFARDALRIMPDAAQGCARLFLARRTELAPLFRAFVEQPSRRAAERLLTPFVQEVLQSPRAMVLSTSYWPSGLFSNARLERYIRKNLERNRVPNNFRLLKRARNKDLYVISTDLNRARTVVFGHDEDNSLAISEAVRASTALPIMYGPARLGGNEYVDAAVLKTAHVTLAVEKGADLIIAYNPFRPLVVPQGAVEPRVEGLGQLGIFTVINQAARMMLHARLQESLDRIRDESSFKGDIVLFEPVETDRSFFATNPVAFWKLASSAEHGFVSVKESIERHHDKLRPILHRYGIEAELAGLRRDFDDIRTRSAHEDEVGMVERMGTRQVPRRLRHLRAVSS